LCSGFNPRACVRRDVYPLTTSATRGLFQSTRLREARPTGALVQYGSNVFQSTRLREARRLACIGATGPGRSFNPRACVRRDWLLAERMRVTSRFQSTRLREARRATEPVKRKWVPVSIHAPA